MVARPRQTAHVCELVELADDAATRTHRLLLLCWQNDGDIDEEEFGRILRSATETVEYTGTGVTVAATVDTTIAAGLSLLHNGYSPRTRRLLGELGNVVAVDFRRDDDPDDDGAALRAA